MRAALHVALAVALGAFGLAASANLHSLSVEMANRHAHILALSLAIWPFMTGGPAFCIALVASWLLARVPARVENK